MPQYTLSGHSIKYNLQLKGWTPFCLQLCLNSSWHTFNTLIIVMITAAADLSTAHL